MSIFYPPEDKGRIYREKVWHNKSFGSDVRLFTKKYYSISNIDGGIENYRDKYMLENLKPDTTVFLDYGCGSGGCLISNAHRIKKGVGIDISDERIESAMNLKNNKNIKNIDFFVMDAMNTLFNNNEFDVIVGDAILHHLDINKSLNEIKRILKLNGKAYFIEPLATNPLIQLYRILTPKQRTVDELPLRRREIKLIKSIFPKADFEYFGCFTLLSIPFRNSKYFDKIVSLLGHFDKYFLGKRSPFKYLAWTCLLTLKN